MKRFFIVVFAVVLGSYTASAQQYDVLEQVANDWRKMSAMEGPHRFDGTDISKAPKGYEPVYISHYGRHGSRYASSSSTYVKLQEILSDGHNARVLTDIGEKFYELFKDFVDVPLTNTGDIVPLGFEQHKMISDIVYDNFAKVFADGRKVNAIASTSQRCIVSMASFCANLKGRNPGIDLFMDSNHASMTIVAPPSAPSALRRNFVGPKESTGLESVESFGRRIVDLDALNARLFKVPTFIDNYEGGIYAFSKVLFSFLTGYRNYCDEPIFDFVLTKEQMVTLWEANNFDSFTYDTEARYRMIPLLEDIIAKADVALGDPSIAADLRFGHDYIAEAFTCLINANSVGTIPSRADEVKEWFQSYNICMATTLLFVFYKNKAGDVIFKLVWNEHDANLPQLTPVTGCYYRWSDFKTWAAGLLAEHPEIIS